MIQKSHGKTNITLPGVREGVTAARDRTDEAARKAAAAVKAAETAAALLKLLNKAAEKVVDEKKASDKPFRFPAEGKVCSAMKVPSQVSNK